MALDPPIQALASEHADLDLDHVEPAGMLGDEVELEPAQDASGLLGREGLVQGAGRMGRQIVEHDPDALGLGIMDLGEVRMQMAKSSAVRRSVTLALRQGRFASRITNTFAVPLRRYS